MQRANGAGIDLHSSLLCRRYLLVVPVNALMQVIDVVGARKRVVCWGVGALSDGQLEFLGVWPEPDPVAGFGQVIANDLSDRGVEVIRFLVASDPIGTDLAMRTSFPDLKVLCGAADSFCQGEGGGEADSAQFALLSTLAPRHRHIYRRTLDAANKWGLCLSRAAGRHGSFSSLAAATAFMRETIIRAERDYSALGPKTATVHVRAAGSSIKRPGIAALSS